MAIPSQGFVKKCRKCGTETAEFYIRGNGKPHSRCKACYKGSVKAYAERNREQVLAKAKRYGAEKRKRIKDATFAAYGGYVCACCGETEQKFLTLDHVNNDGAAQRRAMYGNRQAAGYVTYAWLARKGFPSGCQVLCMNCNHGKRMNKGVCPHKTRCNDHPQAGVGASAPKRNAPELKLVSA